MGSGAQHLIARDFVTRLVPGVPSWLPARPLLACALGLLLIALGLALALGRRVRAAGLVVAAILGMSLALLHLPKIAANPGFGGAWTNPGKVVVLLGAALLLASLGSGETSSSDTAGVPSSKGLAASSLDRRLRRADLLARLCFSGFLILAGVQHFAYREFVATLVPDWIPAHGFWTCFTGTALLAGGVGLLVPRTARLAALLTALMIFCWFLVLHSPRALAAPSEPMEWAGVCESLAMAGVALLLAGTGPRWRE